MQFAGKPIRDGYNTNSPNKGTPAKFLWRLNQYKELITVLVFFLGGVMWIYGFFATKQQLDVYKCQNNTNMATIRNNMTNRFAKDELIAKKMEYEELKEYNHLADNDKRRKIELEEKINLLKDTIKYTILAYEKALNNQRESRC